MSSEERISICLAKGKELRKVCEVVIYPYQIVACQNISGESFHITKHGDGISHMKLEKSGNIAWERKGQPLGDLVGSESLGTFSADVESMSSLPESKRKGKDQLITIPVDRDRGVVEVGVILTDGTNEAISSSVVSLSAQGFQTHTHLSKPTVVIGTKFFPEPTDRVKSTKDRYGI